MKKHLAIVIMLIFIIFPLSAQKTKDVLYLKNGSMIFGKLVEATETQYKIRTEDGSIFIYSLPEVEKFVNEPIRFDGRKKDGFGFALEAGFMVGAQNSEYTAPFSFNFIGNYTTGTRSKFGIGSGVEYIGQSYMPLFAEYKYLLSDRKTTPFMFVRGGRLFHMNGEEHNTDYYYPSYNTRSYSGGFSFTLGTGISWAKDDNETYLSFAYRNAHTSYKDTSSGSIHTTYNNTLNRLEIKFGFMF
jgi:hypothetical protein